MIKAVIVDDIEKFRKNLKQDINDYFDDIEVIGEASSVVEGAKLLKQLKPDVVFLDIQLTDGTGFDIIELLEDVDFKIIFTTASDEYAIKAFKCSAIDYLLKPIDPDELKVAVSKLRETVNNDDYQLLLDNVKSENKAKKLALHSQDKINVVEIKDIVRCESSVNYTTVYLMDGSSVLVTKTLKEYDKLLSEFGFVRVHQSHLINMDHLVEMVKIDGGYLKMKDGSSVPISTRKRAEVMKLLQSIY